VKLICFFHIYDLKVSGGEQVHVE